MDMPPLKKSLLWTLPVCELPDEHGKECQRRARRVIIIHTRESRYPVAACEACAEALDKETRLGKKADR